MASLPWFATPPAADTRHVVIVGAGLAGCHLAVALTEAGVPVTLIDAGAAVAGEASGNTRCVLRPHVVRTTSRLNQFNEQAFVHTKSTLASLACKGQPVECRFPGVLQLLRHQGRWPKLATGRVVDAAQASRLAGLPLTSPALYFAEAGWVDAASYCRALIASITANRHFKLRLNTRVQAVVRAGAKRQDQPGWHLQTAECDRAETLHLQASTVVFCSGAGSKRIAQLAQLPLQLSSGQTTDCDWPLKTPAPKTVLCGKRYLIPTDAGITLGATHWRDNEQTTIDSQDDALNLSALADLLPKLTAHADSRFLQQCLVTGQWRSLRVSTPDRLPLVGAVPDTDFYFEAYANLRHGPNHQVWPAARYHDGLFILTGLGSRGVATASLCATILADQICADTDCESARETQDYADLLHPARFLIRQLKRSPAVAADGILTPEKNRW